MRTMLTLVIGALLAAGVVAGGRPVSLDQIAPSIAQLGQGWTTNQVVALEDPLCAKDKQVPWSATRKIVGEGHREAYSLVRYFYGTNRCFVVCVSRFSRKEDIPKDWGTDKDTKDSPGVLPKVGEEVRFSQRDGVHDDISFRRGRYLINVECVRGHGLDNLKLLAVLLDRNLLRAEKASTPNSQGP